ncbi:MAG: hypothetical protein CLLPBCKN_007581 [Chroococcidiopsis cubana SAG 39.79]|uniref:Uncharacterized protein n=1 Tax=Chroococcidiopsis cubana SAG 39.79 TaxID=388085 RepID=A0AB37UTB2_9CYAN|nr:hypothetical protein [Chroococcidiopsis cubana]MDZ4878146.1 hypothetical protein [Chroococcidiopsis cubana SAG 39.79]PSB65785.1 hypothetical protein C7B79_03980 [Chroococcidiopsis cubana CCALA 043]RUT14586.1 hypothetical protein DSM107010_01320 [Chroococcidiopsis cubana SAG 39.79]
MTAPTHNKQSAGSSASSSADSTVDDPEELAQLNLDDDDEESSDGIVPSSSLNTIASTQSSITDTEITESESSSQDKFDFDRTTIVVNLQILPLHENQRKLLVAVGVADEPPLLFGSTFSALEASSLPLVQAIEKLKESLPQMQARASSRQQPQPKQVPTRQVVVPDLPQAPVARPSDLNQLKLF